MMGKVGRSILNFCWLTIDWSEQSLVLCARITNSSKTGLGRQTNLGNSPMIQSFAILILVLTWWLIYELNPKKHNHELS
jgi:hypothetical protein